MVFKHGIAVDSGSGATPEKPGRKRRPAQREDASSFIHVI